MLVHSGSAAFKSIGSIRFRNPLKLGLYVFLAAGCAQKPPNATQNTIFTPEEIFGPQGPALVSAEPSLNDRLASRVLNEAERRAVWATLGNMARGPVEELEVAANGARFSDVPAAALNAAQSTEMAVRSTVHHWFRMTFDLRDPLAGESRLELSFTPRGLLARLNGTDASEAARLLRGEIVLDVNRLLVDLTDQSAASVREVITQLINDREIDLVAVQDHPEEYRFEMLMLDGQPARLRVVRRPEPNVYSWTAWAGVFPQPEQAQALGASFDQYMRSWGQVPGFPGDDFDPSVSMQTDQD